MSNVYDGNQRVPLTDQRETRRSLTNNGNNMALFNGLFMLTIKDNSNNATKAELLYLVRYCLKFCKAELKRHEFEFGKQGRIHIHAVCHTPKGVLPNVKGLLIYLNRYPIWMEKEQPTPKGHILERTLINLKSLTLHLSPVNDENHFRCLDDNYLSKEKLNYDDVEFID